MNISTRITEYSITGGLLWLMVFLFATILNLQYNHDSITIAHATREWSTWITTLAPLTEALAEIPVPLQSSMSTLLGALAIINIFFSGIVLDLIAPLFFGPFEVFFFYKRLISKNRVWLDRLMAANGEFIEEEYRTFLKGRLMNWKHPLAWFDRRHCYNKIFSFMLAHVMIHSQPSAVNELMDRIHLWRTSRAISVSVLVLGCLLNFTPLAPFSITSENVERVIITSVVVPIVLFFISALITLGAYSRMSLSLCALAYTATQKGDGPA